MIIQNFQGTADDEVGEQAGAGRGKLALAPNERAGSPLFRMACRDAHESLGGEQALLARILKAVGAGAYAFPRALIVNYYVSLKTNPFVILTGAEGRGKTELARLFAEALVGLDDTQYTLISSAGAWPGGTGEDDYYRSLHEQFSSWRFLDILQEASDPSNTGKAYLICFDALHPDELEYYFATLLQISSTGEKRLNLPGFPVERQPIVPPNVYITATVNIAEHKDNLSRNVLRRAGLIEFRAPEPAMAPGRSETSLQPIAAPAEPPPVGYQRLWMRAALHDVTAASARLARILGDDGLLRLQCSPDLARLLWRGGLVLTTHALRELTTYIANSFDEQGRGLFDTQNPHNNARIAFDAQVAQRVLWRLRDSTDGELSRDLAEYLDHSALTATQQAVA